MMTDLDHARAQIMTMIAVQNVSLPVVDDNGNKNVVIALADEKLSELNKRLSRVNGYANLFVKDRRKIYVVSVVNSQCTIEEDPDPLSVYPDSDSTVGMFIDYLARAGQAVGLRSVSNGLVRAEGQKSLVAA